MTGTLVEICTHTYIEGEHLVNVKIAVYLQAKQKGLRGNEPH